jgi:HEAT repeat protein
LLVAQISAFDICKVAFRLSLFFMPTEDEIAKVEKWLAKAPFDDPKALAAQPKFSYEKWFEEGRALPHIKEVLRLLLKKELEQSTGKGPRIAYALGWLGDKGSIEVLTRALEAKDVALRIEAAAALGLIGDAKTLGPLTKLVEDVSEDQNVRANACVSIGRLGVPSGATVLRKAQTDREPFVARAAEEGLRLLGQNGPGR